LSQSSVVSIRGLAASGEEADYADDSHVDETTARQALGDAEHFVDRMERFLRETGAI
jgi:hypothetical protein